MCRWIVPNVSLDNNFPPSRFVVDDDYVHGDFGAHEEILTTLPRVLWDEAGHGDMVGSIIGLPSSLLCVAR